MIAMTEEIVPELAWQMGRPVRYGAGELRGFEERARYMIAIAGEALSDLDPGPKEGFVRYVKRDPLGVVFTIAPWNYPYLTAVNSVIPGLMAGNAVVLKHAASTLLVAERFQQAFDRAKLPEGVFQHLVLDHKQTGEIIAAGHGQHGLLHRVGGRRQGDGGGVGGALHQRGPRARWERPGLRAA